MPGNLPPAYPPAGFMPRPEDDLCTGLDIPCDPWTAEDVAFWTGTATYQPWRDVAAFFKEEHQ